MQGPKWPFLLRYESRDTRDIDFPQVDRLSTDHRILGHHMKSLTTYHPENRKIFRLSQNSTKLFWVTRFREKNLTAQSVLLSEI